MRVCNFLFDFFFDPRINLEAAVWFSNMWELSRKIIRIIFSLTSCSWWYESLQMYYFMAKHMPHLREAALKECIFCRWEFCVLQTRMKSAWQALSFKPPISWWNLSFPVLGQWFVLWPQFSDDLREAAEIFSYEGGCDFHVWNARLGSSVVPASFCNFSFSWSGVTLFSLPMSLLLYFLAGPRV